MSNFKTINGLKEWVNQINVINMHGQTIPLFIIFKGRQYTDLLWQKATRAIGECFIGITENGQLNQEVGMEWLRHFKYHTQHTKVLEHFSGDDNNNNNNNSIHSY